MPCERRASVVLPTPIEPDVCVVRAHFILGVFVALAFSSDYRRVVLAALPLLITAVGSADDSAPGPATQPSVLVARQQQPAPEQIPPVSPVISDRLRPIDEVQLTPGGRREILPTDYAAERFDREPALFQQTGSSRLWGDSMFAWEAPALCHQPLYFEEENLERYGRSHGLIQPAVSVAHFSGRFVAWPYLMGAYPPHECIYTLGRTPPGSYSPYHFYRPPLSLRGAVYEAGAVTGLMFIVP